MPLPSPFPTCNERIVLPHMRKAHMSKCCAIKPTARACPCPSDCLLVCLRVYVHTGFVYPCVCKCVCRYACMYSDMGLCMYVCVCVHKRVHLHMSACLCACVWGYMFASERPHASVSVYVYICMHVYLCNECVPHLVSMYLSGWSCFSNAICPLTTCKPIVFTHVDARIHLYIHYRDEFDLLCKVYIRVEHYASW